MRSIMLLQITTLLLSGCGAAMIAGTGVEDTPDNRAVWNVIEQYRQAMENRDGDALRTLVSRQYYENASTTDTSTDDYGYQELDEKVLPILRDNIKKVQYRILLRSIRVDGQRAYAEYEYYFKFQYSEGGRDQWIARNDFNRLDLVLEDGVWKIVAGL